MTWTSFLSGLRRLATRHGYKPSRRPRPKPPQAWLQVESLETRWMPSTVYFSSSTYSVSEGAGNATITVNLSAPGPEVTVQYATSNGSATAGSDYTATSGTLTIPAFNTSKTFTVPITDDDAS